MTTQKIKMLSPAIIRALKKAASRERGSFCPAPGVHAAAETTLLKALDCRGFVKWDCPEGYARGGTVFYGAPRISDAGRAVVAGLPT